MKNTTVLISGASIAGPALAYWLVRYGCSVTIVERAEGRMRPGGQAVDVRGPALEVIERMGIADAVRARSTRMRGMTMVDESGAELYSSTEHTFTGGDLANADIEIMRDDLALLLQEAAGDEVEYLTGDSIASLAEDADGVHVTFEKAAPLDSTSSSARTACIRRCVRWRSDRSGTTSRTSAPTSPCTPRRTSSASTTGRCSARRARSAAG